MSNDTEAKKREAINIEIVFDTQEELLQVIKDDEGLVDKLFEDAILAVKEAIENNQDSVHLYNIPNFNVKAELNRDQYKSVLSHALKKFIKDENFEKCAELQSLIDKI